MLSSTSGIFALADEDVALPIAMGQTILRPTLVATMLDALDVAPHHRVLQIGTGSATPRRFSAVSRRRS